MKNAAGGLTFHNNADGTPYWGEGLVYEIPQDIADRLRDGAQVRPVYAPASGRRPRSSRRLLSCTFVEACPADRCTCCMSFLLPRCLRLGVWCCSLMLFADPSQELHNLCMKAVPIILASDELLRKLKVRSALSLASAGPRHPISPYCHGTNRSALELRLSAISTRHST